MQIPSYARPGLDAYQSSGTLPGASQRIELDKDNANASLQNHKDEFTRWQSLDESEADLLKGQPGAVRIASQSDYSQGYSEASFVGNSQRGRLTVVQNDPLTHYGFASFSDTKFTPQAAESLSMQYGNNTLLGPQLEHIDRELRSDGPVTLSGHGASVTLTDKGTGGFVLLS